MNSSQRIIAINSVSLIITPINQNVYGLHFSERHRMREREEKKSAAAAAIITTTAVFICAKANTSKRATIHCCCLPITALNLNEDLPK